MLFYVINLGYVKSSLLFSLFTRHFFSLTFVILSFVLLYLINPLNLFTFTYINMLCLGHMADKKQLPSHNFLTSLLNVGSIVYLYDMYYIKRRVSYMYYLSRLLFGMFVYKTNCYALVRPL